MKEREEFLDYIEDMLDAMDKATELIQGVEFAEFKTNYRINFAVIRALEIVGEAAKHVPETIRSQYPQIPWRAIAGMRDKLIHAYNTVNLQLVWETVQQRLPSDKPVLKQILLDYKEVDS